MKSPKVFNREKKLVLNDAPEEVIVEESTARLPSPSDESAKAKVLVAEDDRRIREALVDILTDMGCEAIEARDGAEALEFAVSENPDLLLLDVMMPKLDGFQVLRELRDLPNTKDLMVIQVTAVPAESGEQEAMKLGVNHYITKPWTAGIVEATVRVALLEAKANKNPKPKEPPSAAIEEPNEEPEMEPVGFTPGPDESDAEGSGFVTTGGLMKPLADILGGGITKGSLTLLEGPKDAGKTVVCQHLAYASLYCGGGSAYFTSDQAAKDPAARMNSIGLAVSKYVRSGEFAIMPLEQPVPGQRSNALLSSLATEIGAVVPQFALIVVDPITNLAGTSDHLDVMGFFAICRSLCDNGATLVVTASSYAFEGDMLDRLQSMCDTYLSLRAEKIDGKLVKSLKVHKANNVELSRENLINFQVDRQVGMRITPLGRAKT